MSRLPSVSSLMSPPESKPFENFNTSLSPYTTSQDYCSFAHDMKLPPISSERKRTQSEMDLPSPPVTPYTGNKKRRSDVAEEIERDVVLSSSRDPVLFPHHDSLTDVATDEPLFGQILPPPAEVLMEQHIDSHMARFDNKVNKPTRDEYLLALSCVPVVSAQYNRNPAAWAKEERETLERQLFMMNRCRPKILDAKLKKIAPAPSKRAVATQPRAQRTPRAKRSPKSTPHQKAHESFDLPAPTSTRPPRGIGTNRDDTDYTSIMDFSPSPETLGGNAKALKADWKGQMLDLGQDPDRHLLSPAELSLASTLRLSCATYLCSKRRIFEARVRALRIGKEFRKTDAQQACKIDVNKASKLWTAYDRVGWFDSEHFQQPILTPRSVLPIFFVFGVIFAPIGGLLLWASSQRNDKVQEISIDYSECAEKAPSYPASIADRVKSSFKSSTGQSTPTWERRIENGTTICRLSFEVPDDLGPPVFLYYRLTNFYQNHRRYVKSLDIDQLKGKAVDNKTIDGGSCDPLKLDSTGKAYYPCGLIANSQFNDTIHSPELLSDLNPTVYFMTNKGIAWDSDKELIKTTQYKPWEVVPPPNWHDRYPNGYIDGIPDLHEDEDFMVWMRTAALPAFSKLSRRNDTVSMKAGSYRLDIEDRFPVTEYGGTKSILISTRTVIGGQNPFMGIAYVVVGGICVLLGALFTLAHLVRPRKVQSLLRAGMTDLDRMPIETGSTSELPRSVRVFTWIWGRSSFIGIWDFTSVALNFTCYATALHGRSLCATGGPDSTLRVEHERLGAFESQIDSVSYDMRRALEPIEIETWFHIVSGETDADLVTDEMITLQLHYLQKAYENAAISYQLQGVTRHVNKTWARNGDDLAMKNALRKGGYSTLNVYFQTNLQPPSPTDVASGTSEVDDRHAYNSDLATPSVLGFCTLPDPSINASSPRVSYSKDGCNVLAKTMPGGPMTHYNRGGTAIHEIGHWNGLLHTFEGESCSEDNAGDYIADTPQQSVPTDGCPSQKDSCPESPGFDAIHNFMDYSSDDCYASFTSNQLKRMRSMWFSVRKGK
ncbi:uncharacterized protein CDV56_100567 [Aspergillus thermomutatus]|uniref:SWIRM domain-containing protein n=1 Tax=Aspergillus thermomutatus TaxID=41047 RepID=A0A397G0J8_ASPTH|nr:uncharacterized protein CDV56_100567 [Aspergillus thermomutatus]RHZ43344.1 hypothetical protein CDV56_100567 [Aspergillus thermomutatus]